MSTPGPAETEAEIAAAPGERLRQAREALNLSQQDVAERIRIGAAKVAALEAGDIATLGAPVFAAGYIRAYARIVALPADELIPRFEGLEHLAARPATLASAAGDDGLERLGSGLPGTFSRSDRRRRRGGLRLMAVGLLLLGVSAVVLWAMRSGALSSPDTSPASVVATPLPQKSLPVSGPEVESPQETGQESAAEESAVIAAQALALPEQAGEQLLPASLAGEEAPAVEIPSAPPADGSASAMDTAVAAAMNELGLYFQEDSWVEVHDARGERLMHRLARAGQTQTLHGVAPFAMVLGYVPGVKIILDGEAVDLSKYQGRRLARFSVGDEKANEN